jgi:hypothetical protein
MKSPSRRVKSTVRDKMGPVVRGTHPSILGKVWESAADMKTEYRIDFSGMFTSHF